MIIIKQKVINYVLNEMSEILDDQQLSKLKQVLYISTLDIEMTSTKNEIVEIDDTWKKDLNEYLTCKRTQGCSKRTVSKYKEHLIKLLSYLNKDLKDITDSDIYNYLYKYKTIRNISNRSLENIRLVFSSFFTWATDYRKIQYNPMKIINKIKVESIIKKPFTDEERELISNACNNSRDRAIIELLYSTCMRVGELQQLNKEDINFSKREIIVYGKGAKERVVYLNAKSMIYLRNYLIERNDGSNALFVSADKQRKRLSISGIESILKRIGKQANVENVHPHRFRRTGATNALNRGMPVQEVSEMLGHSNIKTTQIYCTVNINNIKNSHDKYLSA